MTRDAEMIGIFSDRFRNLGVETESVDDLICATNRWLRSKVEAIVLDFDGLSDELAIFAELRKNPSNRNAIVVAIATAVPTKEIAFRNGAQFILQRPFELLQIDRALHAAHRLMLQGRREYFRLTVSLAVSVRRESGAAIECNSINLCRRGMAINTPEPLKIGESLSLSFSAPGSQVVLDAQATVVWDDGHGKAGLRFECVNEYIEQHLFAWLDDQCLLWHKVS